MSEDGDWGMELENFLMACDITSWLDLVHGVLTHGRLHQFCWSDAPSGYDVEQMLRQRGIHCYGRMCQYYNAPGSDGKPVKHLRRRCWVNANQANFAEYNLLGAGVNLESAPVNFDNWKNFGRGAAKPTWTTKRPLRPTMMESISDWLEGLVR